MHLRSSFSELSRKFLARINILLSLRGSSVRESFSSPDQFTFCLRVPLPDSIGHCSEQSHPSVRFFLFYCGMGINGFSPREEMSRATLFLLIAICVSLRINAQCGQVQSLNATQNSQLGTI